MNGENLPESDIGGGRAGKADALVQRARHRLRKIGAWIASIAAVGAIASGLLGYWNVWKTVRAGGLHGTEAAPPTTAKQNAPRLSLVVLPFTNLNLDPGQDYFADAITNDVTTDLAKIPGAFVIGRGTAFSYKNKEIDPRALGKELGVRWGVQGAVQRSGEQVRVNVALTDLTTGGDVWSDRFEGDRANLAALQDGIAVRLARSLNVELLQAEARRAEAGNGRNPDAMDFVMRGWAKCYEQPRSSETVAAARKLFNEAMRLEPGNVDGALGSAYCLNVGVASGYSRARENDLSESKNFVDFALSKRPNSAMAHSLKGEVLRLSGRPEVALQEYDIAQRLDPSLVSAYINKGAALIYAGRAREAIAQEEAALRISPKDPLAFVFHYFLCEAFLHVGDYDRAISACEQSIALNPKFGYSRAYLAAAYALAGKIEEARELVASLRRIAPHWTVQQSIQGTRLYSSNEQFWREAKVIFEAYRKAGVPEE
jgi:adenylate cyclase